MSDCIPPMYSTIEKRCVVYTPPEAGGTRRREVVVPVAPVILGLYAIATVVITLYTLGELHLLWAHYARKRRGLPRAPQGLDPSALPPVTVQIAMFNERYVAERVIDACAALDYPRDQLEIQVCDDSTDQSADIARRRVEHWRERGIAISHIHRTERRGFKAGALAEASRVARGEFIAVFDADFQPAPDFLRRTLPHFRDPQVGIVQSRWGHLNRGYSMLTYVQAVLLDMFFLIETTGRAHLGVFLRFNGSGGVLRKRCLEESGGWSPDTLCEDLDLCYRAQLRGWKAVFDETIVSPAELPVTMNDFKAQQYRWTKGKAQVIRKLLGAILAARVPALTKFHAMVDLMNIFAATSVLVLSACSVPLAYIIWRQPEYARYLAFVSFGLVNLIIAPWFTLIVLHHYFPTAGRTAGEFIKVFPAIVGTALSLPMLQATAVYDGLFRRTGFFHKTAKYSVLRPGDRWRDKLPLSSTRLPLVTAGEALLIVFFGFAAWLSRSVGNWGLLVFHVQLVLSYSWIFLRSVLRI